MQATDALRAIVVVACVALGACATTGVPYSTDIPPATHAGLQDERARFRETFCAVLEAHGRTLPDYRPCEEALARVGGEPAGTGRPVELGASKRRLVAALVPGIGYACFEQWLEAPGTAAQHVRRYGYDLVLLKVDALSGTATNARQIRDAIMAMPNDAAAPRLVLVGYSKGAPDILEAIVTYPEIRSRVAAVLSAAGSIGGSALADDSEQYQADMLRHFPGATCDAGDGGGVESLRPATRKAWLARHPLPQDVRYYSLATFPEPERISSILKSSYRKLARVDARNDSQVIFHDQLVPGSTLVGYLNADHWAVAVPISRSHPMIGSMFVTRNAYPREALLEALLRFVEEDLAPANETQPPGIPTAPAVEAAVLRIAAREGAPLWPNFDPRTIPLAIFDGTQTWLFRHPAPPKDFAPAPGIAGASIMPGRHVAMVANTSTDLGGTTTATLLLDAGKDRSVDAWAAVALHESFHVFQRTRHPTWTANEADLFTYPVEDVDALAWRRIETKALRAALGATTSADTTCWTREALLQRERRFARIGETYAAYERGTERNEGLATYVELRVLGRRDVELPTEEFGPAQVRQRAYATGPALAFLLDRTQPGWQAALEANDTRPLDQLLRDGLARETDACKSVIGALEDATYVAQARIDIDALEAEHQRKLAAFRALPGWRLIIEAPGDKPLLPQGFDPLNVERLAPTQVLHSRYVKFGNDTGSVEMLAGQALSDGVGPHPLFRGVRRVEIAGVGPLKVERVEGGVRVVGSSITVGFEGASATVDAQTVVIHTR